MLSLISHLQGVRTAHPWCCWQRPCPCPHLCSELGRRKSKAEWGGHVKTILKIVSLNVGEFSKKGSKCSRQEARGKTGVPGPSEVTAVQSLQPSGLFPAEMWANVAPDSFYCPGLGKRFSAKGLIPAFLRDERTCQEGFFVSFKFNVRCYKWFRHFRVSFTIAKVTSFCPSNPLFPSCFFWMSWLFLFNAKRMKSGLPVSVLWFCPILTWIFIPIALFSGKKYK